MSDQFGFLDGAKSFSESVKTGKEAGKAIGASIEDVQKEAASVAQQKALERRRQIREAEVLKEQYFKRAMIQWQKQEDIRIKEEQVKKDFVKNHGQKRWSEVEAIKLKIEKQEKEIENEKLYRFIDSWIGVPYRIGGMDKKGVDCSGFTFLLEKEVFDKDLPRTARTMADKVKRKYEQDLEEGDLVFFDFDGQKFSHVGVYLHNNKFVHASTSKGVIISDLKDTWYYKYFTRAGSVKP
jgi:cell wall-associated NlpC family hydrolase